MTIQDNRADIQNRIRRHTVRKNAPLCTNTQDRIPLHTVQRGAPVPISSTNKAALVLDRIVAPTHNTEYVSARCGKACKYPYYGQIAVTNA